MMITDGDALVVVDIQVDFCPGGALPVNEGDQIVPIINGLIPRFRFVALTRDWHPPNHCSFSDTPAFIDGSWPVHCVANTPGAAFHPHLLQPPDAHIVSKAMNADREAYSDFDGTQFAETLRENDIARIFVCGLATDYCVKATALDGVRHGFDVLLLQDACRGVDIPPGNAQAALDAMRASGVTVVSSKDLI